jgi:predicted enzyme related to lactoylglutathione lyase
MPRVVHFEIQATDAEALARFYSELFGWKFSRWGDAPYWLVETGSRDEPGINGGLLQRNGPPPQDGQSVNAFVCTVEVASVDESFARALALGGTAAVPKMPIPTVGWLAYVKDPDGNILGLMQPDPSAGTA